MSNYNLFCFVPKDPNFHPSSDAAKKAEELIASLLDEKSKVSSHYSETAQLFPSGDCWNGVKCPICGRDSESWWWKEVQKFKDSNSNNLVTETQCCGKKVSLNDFIFTGAFGCFIISVEEKSRTKNVLSQHVSEIENVLGCILKAFRYGRG